MVLSARYIRRPRRRYVCDWCERGVTGPHIYLYGMADVGRRPRPLRYCLRCCREYMQPRSEKFRSALARAETDQEGNAP